MKKQYLDTSCYSAETINEIKNELREENISYRTRKDGVLEMWTHDADISIMRAIEYIIN